MPGGSRIAASAVRDVGSAMASCSSDALLESMRDLASAWLVLCSSSLSCGARMCCNLGPSLRRERIGFLEANVKDCWQIDGHELLAEVFQKSCCEDFRGAWRPLQCVSLNPAVISTFATPRQAVAKHACIKKKRSHATYSVGANRQSGASRGPNPARAATACKSYHELTLDHQYFLSQFAQSGHTLRLFCRGAQAGIGFRRIRLCNPFRIARSRLQRVGSRKGIPSAHLAGA